MSQANARYGQGSGPILLTNVMCRGLERRLLQCSHNILDVGSCRHSDDAGIECVEGKYIVL